MSQIKEALDAMVASWQAMRVSADLQQEAQNQILLKAGLQLKRMARA